MPAKQEELLRRLSSRRWTTVMAMRSPWSSA